nr:hypothetical protein CFP56_10480 [Quercus suber]
MRMSQRVVDGDLPMATPDERPRLPPCLFPPYLFPLRKGIVVSKALGRGAVSMVVRFGLAPFLLGDAIWRCDPRDAMRGQA